MSNYWRHTGRLDYVARHLQRAEERKGDFSAAHRSGSGYEGLVVHHLVSGLRHARSIDLQLGRNVADRGVSMVTWRKPIDADTTPVDVTVRASTGACIYIEVKALRRRRSRADQVRGLVEDLEKLTRIARSSSFDTGTLLVTSLGFDPSDFVDILTEAARSRGTTYRSFELQDGTRMCVGMVEVRRTDPEVVRVPRTVRRMSDGRRQCPAVAATQPRPSAGRGPEREPDRASARPPLERVENYLRGRLRYYDAVLARGDQIRATARGCRGTPKPK